MINSPAVPGEDLAATLASEWTSPPPARLVEAVTNDIGDPGFYLRILWVKATERLHGIWTRSSANDVTTKICLKTYHMNELQLHHQQLFAKAPT